MNGKRGGVRARAEMARARGFRTRQERAFAYFEPVRDHTSLYAWQEAHATSLAVIRLSKSSWKPYAAALFTQLQRASLSVQLNIAEGYTYGDSPSFTRHLGIAYGSAVETGELLQLAAEAHVLDEELFRELLERVRRTERLLLGMLKKRREFRA